jgi:hypothetical protein
MNVIKTPANGNTWLSDASIDTEMFLAGVGHDVTDDLSTWVEKRPHLSEPAWDGGDECSEKAIAAYLSCRMGREYIAMDRGNVYNSEQDFSAVFTYTVYVPDDTGDDWLYADAVFIAVCVHLGGDVRGNYNGPRLIRVNDPADSGFFDWVVGWTVAKERWTLAAETHTWLGGGEHITSQLEDERVDRGYSSHPTSELESHYGSQGTWKDGVFIFQDSSGTPTGLTATPYAYVEGEC